jgi:hypothetical protein
MARLIANGTQRTPQYHPDYYAAFVVDPDASVDTSKPANCGRVKTGHFLGAAGTNVHGSGTNACQWRLLFLRFLLSWPL